MLIVDSKSEFIPTEIVDMINGAIAEKASSTLEFPVFLTFGYAFSGSGEKSINEIIAEADKMLYANKEKAGPETYADPVIFFESRPHLTLFVRIFFMIKPEIFGPGAKNEMIGNARYR